jgi:hypothetical protein
MTPNNSTCQPAQQQVLKTGTRHAKLRVVTALFCRIDVALITGHLTQQKPTSVHQQIATFHNTYSMLQEA